MFPNPAYGTALQVRIEFLPEGTDRLQLFDALGRMVLVKKLNDDSKIVDLSAAGWSKGVYYLRIGNVSLPVLIQ